MSQSYTLENSAEENERLSKQANLLYRGPHFLDRFLTSDGLSVLDTACGTGVHTAYVAGRCPKGKVVGLDLEAARIDANRGMYQQHPNLSFQQGDVFRLPFPDASFDLVYCRFLLVHLADQMGAIKEMHRVVKPGGYVVAHELVQDGLWMAPPRPAFQKFFSQWKEMRLKRGQDHSIGLRLYGLFNEAKFSTVEQEVIPNSFVGTDPLVQVYLKNLLGIAKTMKEGGMAAQISDDDMKNIEKELSTIAKSDMCLEITMVVSGKK